MAYENIQPTTDARIITTGSISVQDRDEAIRAKAPDVLGHVNAGNPLVMSDPRPAWFGSPEDPAVPADAVWRYRFGLGWRGEADASVGSLIYRP